MGPNELLLWMSARQSGSWAQFRAMVDGLGMDDTAGEAQTSGFRPHQRVRSALQVLGHVEFDRTEIGNGWRINRPILAVARPGGRIKGILCGARTQPMLARLREVVGPDSLEQNAAAGCPDCIRIAGASEEALGEISDSLALRFQPEAPLNLLARLAPIATTAVGPERSMPFGRDVKIERFAVGRNHCRWVETQIEEANRQNGALFRFMRWQIPEYFFRMNGRSFSTTGQAGKYFILGMMERRVMRYDVRARQLRVPAICRPPMAVDRALTLCSGFQPEEMSAQSPRMETILVYSDVDPAVAGLAAEVLRQSLS